MPDAPLAGRIAIVTGASRGLGLEVARHLCSSGATVTLCSRNGQASAAIADSLALKYGVPVWGSAVDVSSANDLHRFAVGVLERFGPADIVVNNAAVIGPVGRLRFSEATAWSEAIDINVKGVALTTAAFREQLESGGAGRIVNVSGGGVGGPGPMKGASAYLTSKYAIAGLTEALAGEFADAGVTVNSIAPGALPTTFLDSVLAAGPEIAGSGLFADASSRSGVVTAADVRPFLTLLDYLLSDASSHISGRLLSARWETPAVLERLLTAPMHDSLFRLRRIDDDLYSEAAR